MPSNDYDRGHLKLPPSLQKNRTSDGQLLTTIEPLEILHPHCRTNPVLLLQYARKSHIKNVGKTVKFVVGEVRRKKIPDGHAIAEEAISVGRH